MTRQAANFDIYFLIHRHVDTQSFILKYNEIDIVLLLLFKFCISILCFCDFTTAVKYEFFF